MAEVKRQYTDGQNKFLITDAEAAELNKSRPTYLPPITPTDDNAQIRTTYHNPEGQLVDAVVPWQNVQQDAARGKNTVADKASIEQARVERHERDIEATADEADFTTLVNAALPGAQIIQDLAVGEDAANQARQELSTNVAANMVGNLAEYAIGGKVVGMAAKGLLGAERAGKLGVKLGLSKDSGKLAKAGRVAAEEVLVDTHFQVQQALDTGTEMQAETWARQVGVGLVFAAPFVGGTLARGVGQQARKAIGESNALGTLKTAITTGTVMAPAGSAAAQRGARTAAATGLLNKLFRRNKPAAALSATDEALLATKKIDDDLLHAKNNMIPEKLDRMAPGKRQGILDRFKQYAEGDVSFLDAIRWETITDRTGKMAREVEAVRRQTLSMHKKLQGNLVTEVKIPNTVRDRMIMESNEILKLADDVGMGDVKNAIKRGFAGTDDAADMHKALFEARVNARFRRGVSPGADQVDDRLRAFLEDEKLWRGQAKKNKVMNDALDDVVQVWDDLGDTFIPKHLENIDIGDGLNLAKNQGSIQKLRDAMDKLEDAGLISTDQRVAIETRLVSSGDAVKQGTEAYADVIKINRARDGALGKLKKQRDMHTDIPETPEGFAATRASAIVETATDMATWVGKGMDAFLSTRPMVYSARGVGVLSAMSVDQKYETFETIQREMVNLAGNPAYLTEKLSPQMERGAGLDPQGTDMMGQKAVNTIMYLQSQLPPQDDTIYGRGVPQPLSAVEEYLEKWVAAYDPISVGYEIYSGRVTPEMAAAVRVTSPDLFAQMQVEIANVMSQIPADKANPQVLAGANIFMGGLDSLYNGDFIAKIQSSFTQTKSQDQVVNGGMGAQSQGSVKNPGAQSGLTNSQRQQTY